MYHDNIRRSLRHHEVGKSMWSCIPREWHHPANLDKTPSLFAAHGSRSIKQKYDRFIGLYRRTILFIYVQKTSLCGLLIAVCVFWFGPSSGQPLQLPQPPPLFLSLQLISCHLLFLHHGKFQCTCILSPTPDWGGSR